MDPSFSDLRKCIYSTEEEYSRFRAMLINAVMAVSSSLIGSYCVRMDTGSLVTLFFMLTDGHCGCGLEETEKCEMGKGIFKTRQ